MDPWDGWDVGRVVAVLAAVMYLGVWAQMGLLHWAGAFRRWEMWPPVIVTPLIVLAILAGVAQRDGAVGWIAVGALGIGMLEGLAGLWFHLGGVASHIGGLSLRNLMAGPPPLLPVAYALVGAFGLVGMVWNA